MTQSSVPHFKRRDGGCDKVRGGGSGERVVVKARVGGRLLKRSRADFVVEPWGTTPINMTRPRRLRLANQTPIDQAAAVFRDSILARDAPSVDSSSRPSWGCSSSAERVSPATVAADVCPCLARWQAVVRSVVAVVPASCAVLLPM